MTRVFKFNRRDKRTCVINQEVDLNKNEALKKIHKVGKYTIINIKGKEKTVSKKRRDDKQLIAFPLFSKGDYIGMHHGDYLLLSNGKVMQNQVCYDAEESADHPRSIKDIKKQIRQIHYEDFNSLGSMLYDIIKY